MTALKRKIAGSGLKQKYIAEKTGLDRGLISRLARGVQPVKLVEAVSLANFFNCNVDDFCK